MPFLMRQPGCVSQERSGELVDCFLQLDFGKEKPDQIIKEA